MYNRNLQSCRQHFAWKGDNNFNQHRRMSTSKYILLAMKTRRGSIDCSRQLCTMYVPTRNPETKMKGRYFHVIKSKSYRITNSRISVVQMYVVFLSNCKRSKSIDTSSVFGWLIDQVIGKMSINEWVRTFVMYGVLIEIGVTRRNLRNNRNRNGKQNDNDELFKR